MAKEAYLPGTFGLIYSSTPAVYGVVAPSDIWIIEAGKENPGLVEHFEKNEKKEGPGFMIPLFLLGTVTGSRIKEGTFCEERYIKRCACSNVGGDIRIIKGGAEGLFDILWHMKQLFYGSAATYIEEVSKEVGLIRLFNDCGSLAEENMPHYLRVLRSHKK